MERKEERKWKNGRKKELKEELFVNKKLHAHLILLPIVHDMGTYFSFLAC